MFFYFLVLNIFNIFLIYWLDIEIFFLNFFLTFFHFYKGINSIVIDYVHLKKINILFLFLIKISLLELIRFFLEIFY